jgi:hypothetical protein
MEPQSGQSEIHPISDICAAASNRRKAGYWRAARERLSVAKHGCDCEIVQLAEGWGGWMWLLRIGLVVAAITAAPNLMLLLRLTKHPKNISSAL